MSTIKKTDRLIDPATGEYNLTLANVAERMYKKAVEAGEGCTPTFGDEADEAEVEGFGYFKVYPTPRPVGDSYEVTPVADASGKYQQTWKEVVAAVVDPEVAYELERQEKITKVKTVTEAAQEQGCPIDFGEGIGVLHVQMRTQDPGHITVLRIEADEAIAAGKADEVMILRTTENVNVELMAQELVTVSKVYSKQYKTMMGWNWSIVDALRAATYPEPLVDVPDNIPFEPLAHDVVPGAGA